MESGGSFNSQHIYNDATRSVIGEGSATSEGGGSNILEVNEYENVPASNMRNPDEYMPMANILRIMRRVLPPHAKVADDAKETVQECVTEFISFITSEANAMCHSDCRKTITPEDVLLSMAALGFADYVEPLSHFMNRYREQNPERRVTILGFVPPRLIAPSDVDHQLLRVDGGSSGGEGSSGGAEFGQFGPHAV